jgi:hypothetical protein
LKRAIQWIPILVAQVLVVQQPADGQTSTNSNVAVRQETAIEPGSIIAGYASPPNTLFCPLNDEDA